MHVHLPVLPILVPLLFAAAMLLSERRGILVQRALSAAGLACLLAISVALVAVADEGRITAYLLGDWPARLGIALVVDRLNALMVLTTTLLGAACLLHACGGWDRRAIHFHALFQLQLAGLNGAFLTGDLFNLFVFFEVMLIASYGLLLSGGRGPRMRAGLHYVVFNITASTLFLIALGLLYGLLGTLNMAEMGQRVAQADPANLALIRAASGILLVVFCAKAALAPLYLWLPNAYARAPAAVAALFAVMTKVGIYAVLRVYTLVFGGLAGDTPAAMLADWAWAWLLPAGAVTLVLATLGVLASSSLRMLVAFLVIASAATLFIAFSLGTTATLAAGLYYLVHSTFVAAALFLVADLIRRQRGAAGDNLDRNGPLRHNALLGLLFAIGAVSVSGMPPLSGFIGKTLLLDAVPAASMAWVWSVILLTGLLTVVALARTASQVFWRAEPWPDTTPVPAPPGRAHVAAAVVLLGYGLAMTVWAAPVLDYAEAAARQLQSPADYVEAARSTRPQLREPSP
ncbi:monovalent cation/H+ antiporter subunit D [Lysobacter aestuarii]|uniref:Monovalent cation/H+ antiporter subunit D n=1 Tax=Marilutibacter aestuarii TaxID=1706195 RepID=A0A507ZRD7_9GAMM|nr:monovalent cation/H+ antiporter subunit D [Lysobacter aestuarii]